MKYMLLGLVLILAGCATTQHPKNQTIVITEDYYFIGHEVKIDELAKILETADSVVLSVDKNTNQKRVTAVMDKCTKAGITNITFRTMQ